MKLFLLSNKPPKRWLSTKTKQIMRLTSVLLISLALPISASVSSQNVTFKGSNLSARKVLSILKEQTDYVFFYEKGTLKDFQPVNLDLQNASVESALETAFANESITWNIAGKTIFLATKKFDPSTKLEIQQTVVKGKVTDESGAALPGVSLVVKGTKRGTITDNNGEYSISVADSKAVLVFSFIGFASQEIAVGSKTQINVSLKAESKALDEIVVVGYGKQKRATLTGAISTINAKELKTITASNTAIALQGRIPGLQVYRNGGPLAGAGYFQLRGQSSLGINSSPLVLIDGVPGDLNSVNPEQIDNISILKDATSAAVYGSSVAGGVIIITTKSGKEGKARISVNIRQGFNNFVNLLKPLNAREQALLINEARINAGVSATWTPQQIEAMGEGTNWIDKVTRTGITNEANLEISGGGNKSNYLIASNYVKEEGALIGSWAQRFNTRLKLNTDVTNWFKLGINIFAQYQRGRGGANFTRASEYSSIIPEFLADGRPGIIDPTLGGGVQGGQSGGVNPVQAATDPNILGTTNYAPSYSVSTNLTAELKLASFLKFNTIVNYGLNFAYGKTFTPDYQVYDARGVAGGPSALQYNVTPAQRRASAGFSYGHGWSQQSFFSFNKIFAGVHDVSAVAGFRSAEGGSGANINASRVNFPNTVAQNINQGSATNQQGSGSENDTATSLSYFGKLVYTYDNKYTVEGSISRDGSYKFGPANKFGLFGGVGASWRISEEKFFKNLVGDKISEMKLRANYGVVGNDRFTPFLYYSSIKIAGDVYSFGQPPVQGVGGANEDGDLIPNPAVQWETLNTLGFGVDISFLKNWNFTFDWYDKATKNMLFEVPVSQTTGFLRQFQNVGNLSNKGIEISLAYNKEFTKDLEWNSRLIFSKNKNVVKELFNGRTKLTGFGTALIVGKSASTIYGYKVLGIYETQEQVNTLPKKGGVNIGDFIYEDVNGDGKIDPGNDYQALGDGVPKGSFSFTNNVRYKNFDLGVHLTVDYGAQTSQWGEGRFNFAFPDRNVLHYVVGRWHGPGTSTNIAQVQVNNFNNVSGSEPPNSSAVSDSDFMRIRQIELGYTLPKNVLKKIGLESLRIYGTAINPFTFTKLYGWDPESGSGFLRGGVYPIYRTINLGVNVSL